MKKKEYITCKDCKKEVAGKVAGWIETKSGGFLCPRCAYNRAEEKKNEVVIEEESFQLGLIGNFILHIGWLFKEGGFPNKILSDDEHCNYKHLCGLTGDEIDIVSMVYPDICEECVAVVECKKDHAIREIDW